MKKVMLSLIVAITLFLAGPGWAGWSMVDDFEGLTLGDLDGQIAANGSEWLTYAWPNSSTYIENITTINVVDLSGNKAMELEEAAQRYATAQVNLTTPIAENTTGTLYFRAMMNDDPAITNVTQYYAGGYDGIGTQADMKTGGMLGRENPPLYFRIEGGYQGPYISGASMNEWYEFWLVFTMGSGTGTYKVYIAGPGFASVQELDPGDWPLKSYSSPAGIAAMLFTKATSLIPTNKHYFDDLYVDLSGANLSSPYNLQRAHDPTPADEAEGVALDATLEWYTGLADINDPGSWSTSGITHHHIYMSSGNPTDPNLVYQTTISAGAQTGSWTPASLDRDNTYYWRIDEGFNANPADPGVLTGEVWTFFTVPSTPIIDTQPVSVLADPASNPQFTVEATNPLTGDSTGISYKWYDATSGLPLNDGAEYNNTATDTLTVLDAQPGDDIHLFCRVTIATGYTDTDIANLAVRDRLTYWTFDAVKYVGGVHTDEEGFQPAVPGVVGTPTFVTGADGTTSGALVIDADNWCTAGSFVPDEYSGEMSLSFWVNWSGVISPSYYQSIICKRKPSGFSDSHFHTGQLTEANGWFELQSALSGSIVCSPGVRLNAWDHVVITVANYNGDYKLATFYINGLEISSNATFRFGNIADAVVTIGALDTSGINLLNGSLDDVAIYNYALTPTEVANLYTAIHGPYCPEYPLYDFDHNCIVDLNDFAMFAAEWLNCNIFPTCITEIP